MRRYLRRMFEHRSRPLLGRTAFLHRQVRFLLGAMVLVVISLAIGSSGYMYFAHQAPVDAFLNASMILGGMGPVDPVRTPAGKLFASFYALFSGVVFITTAGILIAPVAHRVMHRLHLEEANEE